MSSTHHVDFGSSAVLGRIASPAPLTRALLAQVEAIPMGGALIVRGNEGLHPIRKAHIGLTVEGQLVDKLTQLPLLGWMADPVNGYMADELDKSQVKELVLPRGRFGAEATTHVEILGVLPARATSQARFHYYELGVRVHDGEGGEVYVTLAIVEHPEENRWSWFVSADRNANPPKVIGGRGVVTFDRQGEVIAGHFGRAGLLFGDSEKRAINLSFEFGLLKQKAGYEADARVAHMDGKPGTTLTAFDVLESGVVMAHFSNGAIRPMARLAMAIPGGVQPATVTVRSLERETPSHLR